MSSDGSEQGIAAQPEDKLPCWLIVGGAPRSGTTMLYNILKKSPYIALKNERNLFEQALKFGEKAAAEDYATLLTREQHDRVIYIGEKRPEYYEFSLSRCFPSANVRVIHLSRRPRDAIGSMLARTEQARLGQDSQWSTFFGISDAVDCWLRAWQFAVKDPLGTKILRLKYEDIVSKPESMLNSICEFLELPKTGINGEMVRHAKSHVPLSERNKIEPRALCELDERWDLPLEILEQEYSALKPTRFQQLRRIRRSLLWWYSAGRKKV